MNRKPSINGSISNQPTLSSKILQASQKNDPIRNYLKSMQLEKAIILPIHNVAKCHHEFMVDANKFNQLNNVTPSNPNECNGIRDEIDTCLDAIASVYEQSKANISVDTLSFSQKDNTSLNQTEIKQNVIHRIDPDLIIEYLNTVSRDYPIKNRFQSLTSQSKQKSVQQQQLPQPHPQLQHQQLQRQQLPQQHLQHQQQLQQQQHLQLSQQQLPHQQQLQQQHMQQPLLRSSIHQFPAKPQLSVQSQQRQPIPQAAPRVIFRQNVIMTNQNNQPLRQEKCYSSKRESTIKKKCYLQLTQFTKQERKSFTVQKNKPIEAINNKTTRPTVIMASNPNYHEHLHRKSSILFAGENPQKTTIQKTSEEFRYCINCEALVLSVNIDYHEHYQCQNFKQLYQMNYSQLKNLVRDKIQRMKNELREKICLLRKNQGKGQLLSVTEGKTVVDNIESYLLGIQQEKEKGLDTLKANNGEYTRFKDCLRTTFTETIELTNKLHWFVKIYNNLAEQMIKGSQRCLNVRESLSKIANTPRITKVIARPSSTSIHQNGHSFPFVTPFQSSSDRK